ncbi:MAG: hypothetical protein WC538_20970 [Thermoanaerobaculia bacterium]|jgi:hypothetical protein
MSDFDAFDAAVGLVSSVSLVSFIAYFTKLFPTLGGVEQLRSRILALQDKEVARLTEPLSQAVSLAQRRRKQDTDAETMTKLDSLCAQAMRNVVGTIRELDRDRDAVLNGLQYFHAGLAMQAFLAVIMGTCRILSQQIILGQPGNTWVWYLFQFWWVSLFVFVWLSYPWLIWMNRWHAFRGADKELPILSEAEVKRLLASPPELDLLPQHDAARVVAGEPPMRNRK